MRACRESIKKQRPEIGHTPLSGMLDARRVVHDAYEISVTDP